MPTGLLVNKPGITTPDDQVQEAKHLHNTENAANVTKQELYEINESHQKK